MSKSSDWKSVVSELFNSAQDELKRTTEIGKKMISASRMNSILNQSYEELGRMTAQAIRNKSLGWDDPAVDDLLKRIESYEKDIEEIEGDVNNIKFSESQKNSKSE